jgi:hypothetical protein
MEGSVLSRRGQKCINALVTSERRGFGNSCLHDRLSGARKLVQPANDGSVSIGDIVDP